MKVGESLLLLGFLIFMKCGHKLYITEKPTVQPYFARVRLFLLFNKLRGVPPVQLLFLFFDLMLNLHILCMCLQNFKSNG